VRGFAAGGWAESIGNHVTLDLVNTVAWRLDPDRTVDRLTDGASAVRWAHFAGVIDDRQAAAFSAEMTADPTLGDTVAKQVRGLRERLYRVLQPMALGDEPGIDDVDALRRSLVDARNDAQVATVMPLSWSTGLRKVRDLPVELGLSAWRLLEREDPLRIRQCQDAACGWLFLDRSKNASRVWCSSADCGNRTRARRHYQRHSDAPTPGTSAGRSDSRGRRAGARERAPG
jgi:predicted RNA-binding Zn ribbon-like protein